MADDCRFVGAIGVEQADEIIREMNRLRPDLPPSERLWFWFWLMTHPVYRADADGYPDNAILASAQHETALGAELPGLIALALESVATNAQHHFAKGGKHTVTYGVMEF